MNKVTYIAPIHTAAINGGGTCTVTGWGLRDGAVVHRAIVGPNDYPADDEWNVSYHVTGFVLSRGPSIGSALHKYRRLVARYGQHWPVVLAGKRHRKLKRALVEAQWFDNLQVWP